MCLAISICVAGKSFTLHDAHPIHLEYHGYPSPVFQQLKPKAHRHVDTTQSQAMGASQSSILKTRACDEWFPRTGDEGNHASPAQLNVLVEWGQDGKELRGRQNPIQSTRFDSCDTRPINVGARSLVRKAFLASNEGRSANASDPSRAQRTMLCLSAGSPNSPRQRQQS